MNTATCLFGVVVVLACLMDTSTGAPLTKEELSKELEQLLKNSIQNQEMNEIQVQGGRVPSLERTQDFTNDCPTCVADIFSRFESKK